MRFLSCFVFVCLFGASPAFSATDTIPAPPDSSAYTLNELVISAQRSQKYRFGTPEAIAIQHDKTICQRQDRTTPEALSMVPGVFVQKTNHGGGSPFIRGLTGNQTLLLIDGIRLSNATFRYGPNQYFNTLDVFSLQNIEVLRGSGSVQYGSDALGGVIQAFSRDVDFEEKFRWGGDVLLRGATQNMEQSMRVGLNAATTKAAFTGGLSWRNFGDLAGGDTTGKQSPTGYREMDFDLKAKFAVLPAMTLTVAHQNVNQDNVPVYHKVQLENFAENKFDPQHRDLTYARLEHKLENNFWKSYRLTASLHQTEEGRMSRKNGSETMRTENDKVRSLGFSGEVSTASNSAWSATSGIDVYHDLVNSTRTEKTNGMVTGIRGLYPDGSTMTSFAAFTLHELNLNRWLFTAGARWNTFVINVEDEAIGTAQLTPSALVGNAAVLYKLGGRSNVFTSINTGFRAPNIDDLGTLGIVDFRFETPNYNLKPEHSVQVQLGYQWLSEKLSAEAYVYRNELRDLITRVKMDTQTMQGYPVYQKENVEEGTVQGFETSVEYRFLPRWHVQGSLTYTYGQNITKNEPMRRIPPVFGRLALQYTAGAWFVSTEWVAAGDQERLAQGDIDDNRIPDRGTPGWNVVNLYGGYQWRMLRIQLNTLNLFHTDYRTHGSGVNGIGRSAFVTLGLEW